MPDVIVAALIVLVALWGIAVFCLMVWVVVIGPVVGWVRDRRNPSCQVIPFPSRERDVA